MDILGALLRLYSYLYEFILSAFLFLVSIVVVIGGKNDLHLPMLPWEGASLTRWVFGLSLLGLVITILAALGKLRYAFPVWCLFVVIMMARGYFISAGFYYTGGANQFWGVAWLFVGAVIAFLGSLMLFRTNSYRRR